MARDFTAASSHTVNYGDIGDLGTNKITLACWAYPDTFATTFGLINKRSAHNSGNAYSMGVGYTSNPRWELQLGNAANTAVGAAYYATRSEAAASWYHVCMSYDGSLSAGSRCAILINGVAKTVTAGTDANVTPGNAASDLVLGRVNNTGTLYFDGRMAEPAIWDVALSAEEVAALAKGYSPDRIRPASLAFYDDLVRTLRDIMTGTAGTSSSAVIDHPPIIRRRRAQIFVPKVAAGGGITLSIDDATHGHTADGVSLTQQHQLAVQDASHAHAVDNLALTQQNQLAVADATHGHAADNVTLSTEIELSIADALHGHSVDNITLVQQHVLAVDDATHGHSADNVVLATGTNLAVADALHGHTVDNLVLTQQHVLVVADALHQHSADNIVLGGLPVAAVEEGGGGPDREESEQPAERFTKDGSGWRKPKWVQEREQLEAAAVAKPAEKAVAPVDEREALIASAKASDALAASLERAQPPIVAAQEQPVDAQAPQTAAVDFERARIAAKVRQQREIEEIMTVLMMAA